MGNTWVIKGDLLNDVEMSTSCIKKTFQKNCAHILVNCFSFLSMDDVISLFIVLIIEWQFKAFSMKIRANVAKRTLKSAVLKWGWHKCELYWNMIQLPRQQISSLQVLDPYILIDFASSESIVDAFVIIWWSFGVRQKIFPDREMFAVNGAYACCQCRLPWCWY